MLNIVVFPIACTGTATGIAVIAAVLVPREEAGKDKSRRSWVLVLARAVMCQREKRDNKLAALISLRVWHTSSSGPCPVGWYRKYNTILYIYPDEGE